MRAALYNAAIMAEAKAAYGAGRLEHPTVRVRCDNPLCGDRIGLDLEVTGGRIGRAAHHTRGCLLTQAAAALLVRHIEGRNIVDAEALGNEVRAFLAGAGAPADWPELAIFTPVREVKGRQQCVLLPFKALSDALGELAIDDPAASGQALAAEARQ